MKIRYILVIFCVITAFLAPTNVFSQNNKHGLGSQSIGTQVKSNASGNQTAKAKSSGSNKTKGSKGSKAGSTFEGNVGVRSTFIHATLESTKDSVCYFTITKRHGWPEGIGKPLTKEELTQVPVYYVLSHKNSAGKWTIMRAFDAYGNLTTNHSWGAYILNQNDEYDTGANSDWVDKLKTVCQWEYIGDSDGKEVIQERALDQNNNVVFCYNIVKIKENKDDGSSIYSGSYTDAFALPIFMRTDSLGNYKGHANFVQVKRDKQGYETLFAFTDETGHIRLNKDGAYQTSKAYDNNGRQIREASLDLAGNQMIDYYGNCGWQNIVDEYGNILRAQYFGKNNEPVKMPGTRGSSQVYGYEFNYDKYHREHDRYYLDAQGNRDVNEYGVYHSISEYNNHGQRIRASHFDKDGNLIGSDEYGIAQVITEYDNNGNITLIEWQDKNCSPINGYGDYCKRTLTYDTVGNTLSQFDYIRDVDGNLINSFKYEKDSNGNELRYWYTEGYYKTDSVDVKGRTTLEAWFNLDGKPIARPTNDDDVWHKHVITYDDENNIEKQEWYDIDGDSYVNTAYNLSNKYNLSIDETDVNNNILTNTQYLKPFGLAQKFQKQFDDYGNIVAQWDVTPYGAHTRVGWWNNLHYKCNVNYTMYGEIMDMICVNEFDEPSYFVSLNDDGEVYHYSDLGTYYDENMQVIPADSMLSFKHSLPKAFCIEVTDTIVAYPLGLRNGDIILSYGDWTISEDLLSNMDYFYLETILKNKSPKVITLLRHDINSKTSKIVSFDLPEGKPSELGFYPHQIYYTQKEATRLHDACDLISFKYGDTPKGQNKRVLIGVQLKGGLVQTRFYHFPMYDFKDPGFLLYAYEKYNNGLDTWNVLSDDIEAWNDKKMFNSNFSGETQLYFTQDMKSIKKLSKNSSGNRGLRILPINVSNDVYDNLISCYKTIDELSEISKESDKQKTLQIKEKQLFGKWNAITEQEESTIDLMLDLDKKHNVNLNMAITISGEISPGITLNLRIIGTNNGLWKLQDNILYLEMEDDTCKMGIDKIEFIGASEEQQNILMNQFAGHESELLQMLTSNVTEINHFKTLEILNVTKSEMVLELDNDKITFKKER